MTAAIPTTQVRRHGGFAPRLREITRGIAIETESPDPKVIARGVIDRLTDHQYREALEVCLTDWVRSELAQMARTHRSAAKGGALTTPQRVRAWYAHQLATSLFVGDQWKFLRDCTADDLHNAASERYRKATETHAEGDRWTKVALFMEEHARSTVANITEAELKTLMEES